MCNLSETKANVYLQDAVHGKLMYFLQKINNNLNNTQLDSKLELI